MNQFLHSFFLDVPPPTFWNGASGSVGLIIKLVVAFLVAAVVCFLIKDVGPKGRKYIIGGITFISGAFYVMYFLWPTPVHRQPTEMPANLSESISFWLDDALPQVGTIANTLAAFMLGLGVFSVVSIHFKRLIRQQRDWGFSVVLLVSMVVMTVVGYWDWKVRTFGADGPKLDDPVNWHPINYANDLVFNGLLQQMDAAMFSVIAFYILSAAYRAFRIRSVEATILLSSALVVILSLMGLVEYGWNLLFHQTDPNSIWSLGEIAKWLRDCFQSSSIRAIDFGVGIGALAMGLRLWLSLEKQGAN